MDPKQPNDYYTQAIQFLVKNLAWIGWVVLGLIGRFSYDLIRDKKFTRAYILGCTGLSILGGYLSGVWFFAYYPTQAPLIVPLVTMLSNNLVSALMAINYKALMEKQWAAAFEAFRRNLDKD